MKATMIFFLWSFLSVLPLLSAQEEKEPDYGIAESFVEFHGLIAPEFSDYEKDGPNNGQSSFDARNTYLLANCAIRENINGIIEIKFDHGGETFKIDRAYFDVRHNDWLNFRAGKFYLPITANVKDYRPTGTAMVTPGFPSMVNPDMFRDVGVGVFGGSVINKMEFGYELTVTNGAIFGRFTNDVWGGSFDEVSRDINQNKALSAEISFAPLETLTLKLAILECTPNWEFKSVSLQPTIIPGVFDEIVTIIPLGEIDFSFNSFTVDHSIGPLSIKGSYDWGVLDPKIGGEAGDVSFFKLEVAYRALEGGRINFLDFVARTQLFTLEMSKITPLIPAPEKTAIHALGISFSPYENFILKIEYQWRDEIDAVEQKDNAVFLQAVIDF